MALLVGAVNNEVAPVRPIAIVLGKLGVSAVFVAASFVKTAFVQLGHIETINEFDNLEFAIMLLNIQLTWQEYTPLSTAFVGETVRVAVDPLIANEFVKVAAVSAGQVPSQVLTFEQSEHLKH